MTKVRYPRGVVKYPKQPTYEKRLAQSIAQLHAATVKQFGVPAWMLRDPGPTVAMPDDDVAFEEG